MFILQAKKYILYVHGKNNNKKNYFVSGKLGIV